MGADLGISNAAGAVAKIPVFTVYVGRAERRLRFGIARLNRQREKCDE